jgi:hypothetical protein
MMNPFAGWKLNHQLAEAEELPEGYPARATQ